MGTFRVEVQAVGNHGCQRDKADGETVDGCGHPGCTDCVARDFVAKLRATGASIERATVAHWPHQTPQPGPVDNLLTKTRDKPFSAPLPKEPEEHILQFFQYGHLPPHLQAVSQPFYDSAHALMALPRNPERTVALRKLLEAKDAAVRAKLAK